MSITKKIVSKPITWIIVFALIIGLGLYILGNIPIDLMPDFNPPVLVVYTSYSGAGPEEVEQTVTRLLEGNLSNVGKIREITSTSSEGYSQIMMEFGWGTNMDEASNEVRDKLEFVKEFLPDAAGTPQIFKFDPSMIPILNLVVRGDRSADELLEIARDIIQPKLEQVDGVALTSASGGREKLVRVEISQNRLEAYGLTLTQVAGMLAGQNLQIGSGSIAEGSRKYLIRTSGEYSAIEQIENTVVAYRGGAGGGSASSGSAAGTSVVPSKVVRLRDIADVFEGFEDRENVVYINGEPGVYVSVQKQSGTNSVQIADRVLERLNRINRQLPVGVEVSVIRDTTEMIRASLNQVTSTLLYGGLFAVIVLLFFLRRFRSTLVIALSIPISLLATMIGMYFAGLTFNVLSLAGLILGIGMIVDSSIVILENIYRYREKGARLNTAAVLGSQEMITAITASTLTTVCVFLPLLLFKNRLDMVGVMINDLAFTVVVALLASLAVAVFLVPVLASKVLPITTGTQKPIKNKFLKRIDNGLERLFTGLENVYRRILGGLLNHRLATILVILVLFAGSLLLLPRAGFEFMPDMGDDSVVVDVELPLGTTLEATEALMNRLALIVEQEISAYEDIIVTVGEGNMLSRSSPSHRGTLTVTLPEYGERIDDSETVKQKLRRYFNEFPGAVFSFGSSMGGRHNMSGGSPVDIIVRFDNLARARDTALQIQGLLRDQVPGATEPKIALEDGLPQIEIMIDRDKAYALGLNIASIGKEIRAGIAGLKATIFRDEGEEYDVLVILQEKDRSSIPDLQKIFVLNSMGRRIPLASFAHLEKTTGPVDIQRENQARTVHVTAGIRPGARMNEVQGKIETLLAERIVQDDELAIEYGGDMADLMKYGTTLIILVLMAVLLVFGVMASQFESFKDPFIMFFTIPLLFIGVVAIYLITGQPFSIFTAVGLVMLVGIVVNNGIVLVDYTNLLRKRGMGVRGACIEAGGHRLRPILMTSLTTILGLAPMAFFPGEGSELVQPIGLTVIGGLVSATMLTLLLIPVLYSVFNEKRKGKKRLTEETAFKVGEIKELVHEAN